MTEPKSDNPIEYEERCSACGGTWDNPQMLSDDSYSTFSCPYPFHEKPSWVKYTYK